MRRGEDHERFDAITVMKNRTRTNPVFVKKLTGTIEKMANKIDKTVVMREA
jgi:hypothetical protein